MQCDVTVSSLVTIIQKRIIQSERDCINIILIIAVCVEKLEKTKFLSVIIQGHCQPPRSLHTALPPWVSRWRSGTCLWQVGIKETKSNLLFLKASKAELDN